MPSAASASPDRTADSPAMRRAPRPAQTRPRRLRAERVGSEPIGGSMKSLLSVLTCAALAVMGATFAASAGDAPQAGPIHVTSFFEVTPGQVNQAIGMLKQYRDAAKAE